MNELRSLVALARRRVDPSLLQTLYIFSKDLIMLLVLERIFLYPHVLGVDRLFVHPLEHFRAEIFYPVSKQCHPISLLAFLQPVEASANDQT